MPNLVDMNTTKSGVGYCQYMFSYLDAGTGSMIVTAVAGGVAGLGVAAKMGMARLKSKVTGKPVPSIEEGDDDDSDSSSHD
jgi:hypothetical protein